MAEIVEIVGMPTREDVEVFAANLPENFLHCRSWGHAKKVRITRDVQFEGSSKVYMEVVLFCQNACGVSWIQIIDPETGVTIYSGSRYPAEYLAKGIGRIQGVARGFVKIEALQRHKETHPEEPTE